MAELESGLLKWSEKLADWQRDLLRRLAVGEALGNHDLCVYAAAAERTELEKGAPWYIKPTLGDPPTFLPLDATDLAATAMGDDPVRIERVVHIHGANDLADGTFLDFGLAGLTVVAGRNGSGKSGYTRILKQVAASRASEDVLPNVYRPDRTPKALISYHVGDSVVQDMTWVANGGCTESQLRRVRVFDARVASVHLTGSTDIAYIPSSLQIIADYTRVLGDVSAIIDAHLNELRLQNRNWPSLSSGIGAEIFEHFGREEALTAMSSVSALTPEEEEELADIPAKISVLTASNPAARAVQARLRAQQLSLLADNLEIVRAKISCDAISLSERLITDVATATTKTAAARMIVEGEDIIPGTGGPEWERLWDAARSFMESGHELAFPDDSEDARCPLCQQGLDEDAKSRIARFAEFMCGEAQIELTAARRLRDADIDALGTLPLDSLLTKDLIDLLGLYDEELGRSLPLAVSSAIAIRDDLVAGNTVIKRKTPSSIDMIGVNVNQAVKVLREAASSESDIAESLATSDASTEAAATLQQRLQELTVRRGLMEDMEAIGAQHDRAVSVLCLDASKKHCGTTSASRTNSELSSTYVNRVCQSFAREAINLGLSRVPVELVFDRSARGVSFIKVVLRGAQQIPVTAVLSEGEQRIAAIAGFFADLTESGDTSALIFDDPVSSLDQEFRSKVANRLLEEAESRQVLVFTHDFSFVQYLYEEKGIRDLQATAEGRESAPALCYRHIDRACEGAGVQTTAEEWRHVSVKDRIGRIKQRIQAASVLYRDDNRTGYGTAARDISGAIREAWEAFVEQDLLNAVVTRHDRRVQTKRLSNLIDLTAADIATVELGMSIESRFMAGHAGPTSDGSAPMSPDGLTVEIKRLEELRAAIIRRR